MSLAPPATSIQPPIETPAPATVDAPPAGAVPPGVRALKAWAYFEPAAAHDLVDRGLGADSIPAGPPWPGLRLALDEPPEQHDKVLVTFRIHDAARIADLGVTAERDACRPLMAASTRDEAIALAARLGVDGMVNPAGDTLTLLNPRAAMVLTRDRDLPARPQFTIAFFETLEQVRAGEWQGMAIEVDPTRAAEMVRAAVRQFGIAVTFRGDAWPGCDLSPTAWTANDLDIEAALADLYRPDADCDARTSAAPERRPAPRPGR